MLYKESLHNLYKLRSLGKADKLGRKFMCVTLENMIIRYIIIVTIESHSESH